MRSIPLTELLDHHIPYRLAHLEACVLALWLIDKRISSADIKVSCGDVHLLDGKCSMLTNAWTEVGLIACRVIQDFLRGHKLNDSDATIEMFTRPDGKRLQKLTNRDLAKAGPKSVTRDYLEHSLKRTRDLANHGVAHMKNIDTRVAHDPLFLSFACKTLHSAALIYLYDEIQHPRPRSAFTGEGISAAEVKTIQGGLSQSIAPLPRGKVSDSDM